MTIDTDPRFERWRDLVLASVPALASEAAQRALEQLQGSALSNAVAGDRQHTASLLTLLRPGPHGLAAAFSAALRQQLREEFARDPQADSAPRAGAAATVPIDQLTLVDDQQIEEDIEVARVIQLVDTAAEVELRDLRALCATLRSAPAALPELVPLRPEVAARALSRALQSLGLARDARLLALRMVGKAVADRLGRAGARAHARAQALGRRAAAVPTARGARAAACHVARRRCDAAAGRQDRCIGSTGEQLIPRLLAQVAAQSQLDPSLGALLQRLAAPALRSAKVESGVLSSFQHPVWRLVDRIAALGALRAGAHAARLAEHLEPVVLQLELGADSSFSAYERALAEIDELATGWADSQLADAGVTVPGSACGGWLAAHRLGRRGQPAHRADGAAGPGGCRPAQGLGRWLARG